MPRKSKEDKKFQEQLRKLVIATGTKVVLTEDDYKQKKR